MTESFLAGRSALVTGGTSGIGLAIAVALAGAGARVAINGLGTPAQVDGALAAVRAAGARTRTADPIAAHAIAADAIAADAIGAGATAAPADARPRHFDADLADADAIAAMMAAHGDCDVLVNCAGVQHTAPISDMPAATWDRILAINLSAAFHTMRAALPGMAARGYGRVVNIASVHGLVASVQKAPYVAAKHGLIGLSKVAALEHAAAGSRASGGVTVNCVCPGWVETPLIEPQIAARALAHGGDRDAGVRELLREKQPSGRMARPEEIAALVLWLCRPEAHNLTGAALPVDGGWTAQ